MNKNLTEIILILDRSASMQSIKSDMEGALKAFIQDQKTVDGECNVSLFTFDNETTTEYEAKSLSKIDDIKINPRGSTALFDAICLAVDKVGERLSKTREKDRPSKVVAAIVSDGQENASRQKTAKDVRERISHQESKYSWQFVYLGANQDAFANGQNLGFNPARSVTYSTSHKGITNSTSLLSDKIKSYRSGDMAAISYSAEDRELSQL